ncbi:MAG: RNA-directed DNA polymerase [Candidatus Uhrbacteria bacterium]
MLVGIMIICLVRLELRCVSPGALEETKRSHGLPIGNLTSQLFANVYLDAFDHFVKDELKIKFYLRYTDDAIILSDDLKFLSSLISVIKDWFEKNRRLVLHPGKTSTRKFCQGFDFLGYIVLPHYTVLRTKTKKRMLERVNKNNLSSYLGLLEHCQGFGLEKRIRRILANLSQFILF